MQSNVRKQQQLTG